MGAPVRDDCRLSLSDGQDATSVGSGQGIRPAPISSSHLSALLNHRAARVGWAGCVVMRLARFVGIEPALTGCAHLVGDGSDGVRTDRTVHLLARCVGESIATLTSSGEGLVNRLLTAAGRKSGYTFTYTPGEKVNGERIAT